MSRYHGSMKKPRTRSATVKELSTTDLRRAVGGDNPGMGPYDPPTQTRCWIRMSDGKGIVYVPNDIAGVGCPMIEA
jgi:hypothetical protein